MPKITEIIVSAGRKFNHPLENFSNLSHNITLKIVLEEGDKWQRILREAQARAETMIEEHKIAVIEAIREQERESMGSWGGKKATKSLEDIILKKTEACDALRSGKRLLIMEESNED